MISLLNYTTMTMKGNLAALMMIAELMSPQPHRSRRVQRSKAKPEPFRFPQGDRDCIFEILKDDYLVGCHFQIQGGTAKARIKCERKIRAQLQAYVQGTSMEYLISFKQFSIYETRSSRPDTVDTIPE